MIKKFIIILALVFSSLSLRAQDPADAFKTYRQAALAGDGAAAIGSVNSSTIKYFSFIRDAALNSDSVKVDSMRLVDKFMTLTVRYLIPAQELRGMDGAGLFKYAVSKKLVGREELNQLEVKNVQIEDDWARGQVSAGGKATPYFFDFQKEEGVWRLDLSSIFDMTNTALKQAIEKSGMSANEFMIFALHYSGDHKPGPEIWHPAK